MCVACWQALYLHCLWGSVPFPSVSLNSQIPTGFPLQTDSGEAQEPTWNTTPYKQRHPFGLLFSRVLEVHEGERHFKRITSLFKALFDERVE